MLYQLSYAGNTFILSESRYELETLHDALLETLRQALNDPFSITRLASASN